MLNAKNLSVKVGNTEMDYISFGHGDKPFVMLPGLGDALKTVKGTALYRLPLASATTQVRGLIQMPFSRHWIMHIEACMRIKNKIGGS